MTTGNKKSIGKKAQSALEYLFIGYGWKAFLLRLCLVVISFRFNPFDFAVHQSATAPMKFFLLTCAILAYAIFELIVDYTKLGVQRQKELIQSDSIDSNK